MKKLPKNFVESYADEVPPWGPVGYITYKRTYARLTEKTGQTEEWHEHCGRLVNGLLELGAPYTEDEAMELFDVLFYMKGSVSGRAHWQLGTRTVREIGADSLQNCFAGETEFLTDQGVKQLDECVGETVLVYTRDGWREGVVSQFGEQELYEVTTLRNSYIATANHEWIVDGERVYTVNLEGKRLPLNPQRASGLSRRGQAHGFVFGDGHAYNKRFTAAYLFGEKAQLYSLLGEFGTKTVWGGDLVVHSMPGNWKSILETDCRNYACGFLSGLIAADGNVRGNSIRIHNKCPETLQKIKRLAQFVGFRVGEVYMDREINPFDGSVSPCYCITLNAYTELPDGFFIREDQRVAFGNRLFDKTEKVTSVTPTGRKEKVYCVTVPGVSEFTLANGTLTGNCWHVACRDLEAFCFTFDELMLGGGVGYNIQAEHVYELPQVKYKPSVTHESTADCDFIVPDNREGWVELLRKMLASYFTTGKRLNYSTQCIRPAGARIKGFGGVASGANALVTGINQISTVLRGAHRRKLRPTECLDIMNIIGSVVVSGNVRRSAQIALGDPNDFEYLAAKNWASGKVPAWRAMSNNSIVTSSIDALPDEFWSGYDGSGEPYGLINLDACRKYGRLADGEKYRPDPDVLGVNPCFPSDVRFLTRDGWRTFAESLGADPVIHQDNRVTFDKDWNVDVSTSPNS